MGKIGEKVSFTDNVHTFFYKPKEFGDPRSFKRGLAIAVSVLSGIANLGIIRGLVQLHYRITKHSPKVAVKTTVVTQPVLLSSSEEVVRNREETMKRLPDKKEKMEIFIKIFSDEKRLKEEGIFRISPELAKLEQLNEEFVSSKGVFGKAKELKEAAEFGSHGDGIQLENEKLFDAYKTEEYAGLFKRFVKSCDLFEQIDKTVFADLAKNQKNNTTKELIDPPVELIKKNILEKMSEEKKNLLKGLLTIFGNVIKNVEQNKMESKNLAICISPNLLSESISIEESMKFQEPYRIVFQLMIDHREELFPLL